jgi:hypothetical protein
MEVSLAYKVRNLLTFSLIRHSLPVLAEKMSEEGRQLRLDTKAVMLGHKPDVSNNYSLVPPIGLSSTFQQDDPSSDRVSAHSNLTKILSSGYN